MGATDFGFERVLKFGMLGPESLYTLFIAHIYLHIVSDPMTSQPKL